MSDSNSGKSNVDTMTAYANSNYTAKEDFLGTCELFESIIIALLPQDILISAVAVNKAWHNNIIASVAVNKHLISSSFLLDRAKDNCITDDSVTHLDFFWGDIIIKRLQHTGVIYAIDKAQRENFQPCFLHASISQKNSRLDSAGSRPISSRMDEGDQVLD
jgi:hypothetical protein